VLAANDGGGSGDAGPLPVLPAQVQAALVARAAAVMAVLRDVSFNGAGAGGGWRSRLPALKGAAAARARPTSGAPLLPGVKRAPRLPSLTETRLSDPSQLHISVPQQQPIPLPAAGAGAPAAEPAAAPAPAPAISGAAILPAAAPPPEPTQSAAERREALDALIRDRLRRTAGLRRRLAADVAAAAAFGAHPAVRRAAASRIALTAE